MIKKLIICPLIIFVIVLSSCTYPQQDQKAANPESPKDLTEVQFTLPQGQGYDAFMANCTICHSARYIQMQPPFSHKTWEKTVDKMIKKFGAPVPDSSVAPILNYLMAVRGKQ